MITVAESFGKSPFYDEFDEDRDIAWEAHKNEQIASGCKAMYAVEIIEEFPGAPVESGMVKEARFSGLQSDGNPREGFTFRRYGYLLKGHGKYGESVPFYFQHDWSEN